MDDMKELFDSNFDIEIISKTEFVDDYSFMDEKYLVTIWNVRASAKTLNDYLKSETLTGDWEWHYETREEYEADCERRSLARKQWEKSFEELLGQHKLIIKQVHAEFFTAIKIAKIAE